MLHRFYVAMQASVFGHASWDSQVNALIAHFESNKLTVV
jgi:hypothetical protein